jgi:Lipocalin-like domain
MTSRKAISFLLGLLLVLFVSASALAADEQLYGTWRLISFIRTVVSTGESTDIFGKSPQGTFIFGRDGRALVLIVSDKRPKVSDLTKLTDSERAELFKTMIAYGGTYTFDGKTLKLRPDISWNDNWTGLEQTRLVKFEGNRLFLSTIPAPSVVDGKIVTSVLAWERVK